MDAPSLEAFKARLDVALGSLVWCLATLHIAGGLKLHDHRGPFQPRPFHDSITYIYIKMYTHTHTYIKYIYYFIIFILFIYIYIKVLWGRVMRFHLCLQVQWLGLHCPSIGNTCIASPRDAFFLNATRNKIGTKKKKRQSWSRWKAQAQGSAWDVSGFQPITWLNWDICSPSWADKAKGKKN